MAEIRIEGPDGSSFSFPEGTPESTITAAMQAHYGATRSAPETAAEPVKPEPAMPAGGDPGALSTSVLSGGNALTFGWGDEIGSAVFAPVEAAIGAYTGEDDGKSLTDRIMDGYSRGLRKREDLMAYAEAKHPVASTVGSVAGSVAGASGLAKAGLSAAANAAQKGAGLAKVAGASAADGALIGGVSGAGEGSGLADRISKAGSGAVGGGAVGLAAPLAIAGAGALTAPIRNIVTSRIVPQRFADSALETAMRRAGATPDSISQQLVDASADGQGVFTVADALGNSGQRMLSTVTRTPNDARQATVEALLSRQAGQGRRVSNALAEGFDASDTAIQRATALTTARDDAADVAYNAARQGAGAVDVTPAIKAIDNVVPPGMKGQIAEDSVEGVMARARAMLTKGDANLTEFSSVLRVKQDIDDMIGKATRAGSNNQARNLMQVKTALDGALSSASPAYSGARDAFRTGSKAIEAIDLGKTAARTGRYEDTMRAFQKLSTEEKAGFRVGYANQMIEQTQGAAAGVNKVRPLRTDAAEAEFPEFAAPGRGDQLSRRIQREDTMFQTQNAALGGSRTADNLADMEDMANFDPAMIARLLNRDFVGAGLQALTKVVNEAKGMPPRVVEKVAQGLMETDPAAAKRILQAANTKALNNQGRKAVVLNVLNSLAAPGAGQSASP